MKKLFRLIVLVLMLGGWVLSALSLHIVRDGSRIVVIPKQHLDYHDTYIDTTKWSLDDVAKHPSVVTRLIQTGKADVLQHAGPQEQLRNAIERGVTAKPATQPAGMSV